jgi:16S rRNA G966 N2-methylase RsmD
MNLVKRIYDSLRIRGIIGSLKMLFSFIVDYCFDIKNGTDTFWRVNLDEFEISDEQRDRGQGYQPTHAFPLRKLFGKLMIPSGKVLVDFGSGKGRVLLIASEYGFKEVRGIELSSELCDIARKNVSVYKEKIKTETICTILNTDVLDYQVKDDEDVFYMYNPFDDYVVTRVMEKINESYSNHKRKIWIIYRNAVHDEIIKSSKNFSHFADFVFLEQDFVVYTSG